MSCHFTTVKAQCPPAGDLVFGTQAEIDQFIIDYPNCTEIDGGVEINNFISFFESIISMEDSETWITSLAPLSNIEIINGNFNLTYLGFYGYVDDLGGLHLYPSELNSLSVLSNLTIIEGDLNITSTSLSDFTLNSLTNINGNLNINYNYINGSSQAENQMLGTPILNGFNSLEYIGGNLLIENNLLLTEISAFSNLNTLSGSLVIRENNNLVDISNLSNLSYINGVVAISDNPNLSDCCVIECLSQITNGWVDVHDNGITCNSFEEINENCVLDDCFNAIECPPEGDLILDSQLEIDQFIIDYPNCSSHQGDVYIRNANNLNGLLNLTEIGGNLYVQDNFLLENIDGLSNLTTINGDLTIRDNFNLEDISGLSNLISVSGGLKVVSNNSLSNCCEIECIMQLTQEELFIYGNATHCNSLQEIENSCGVGNCATDFGCTEPCAINYNPNAISDDGSCTFACPTGTTINLTTCDCIDCENNPPNISLTDVSVCIEEAPVIITAPSGFNAYNWSNGLTTQNISVINSGVYTLTVTDSNGCSASASAVVSISNCNQCPPAGNLTFTTQAEIDQFAIDYPNCTEIEGSLNINDQLNGTVLNLNAFSNIELINGDLSISSFLDTNDGNGDGFPEPSPLTSINGLSNLSTVNGDLFLNCSSISDIELNSLLYVGGDFEINACQFTLNDSSGNTTISLGLNAVNGLNNLNTIEGDLIIRYNNLLENLEGFNNLCTLGGSLYVENNTGLLNCCVLGCLAQITQDGFSMVNNGGNCNSLSEIQTDCVAQNYECSCEDISLQPSIKGSIIDLNILENYSAISQYNNTDLLFKVELYEANNPNELVNISMVYNEFEIDVFNSSATEYIIKVSDGSFVGTPLTMPSIQTTISVGDSIGIVFPASLYREIEEQTNNFKEIVEKQSANFSINSLDVPLDYDYYIEQNLLENWENIAIENQELLVEQMARVYALNTLLKAHFEDAEKLLNDATDSSYEIINFFLKQMQIADNISKAINSFLEKIGVSSTSEEKKEIELIKKTIQNSIKINTKLIEILFGDDNEAVKEISEIFKDLKRKLSDDQVEESVKFFQGLSLKPLFTDLPKSLILKNHFIGKADVSGTQNTIKTVSDGINNLSNYQNPSFPYNFSVNELLQEKIAINNPEVVGCLGWSDSAFQVDDFRSEYEELEDITDCVFGLSENLDNISNLADITLALEKLNESVSNLGKELNLDFLDADDSFLSLLSNKIGSYSENIKIGQTITHGVRAAVNLGAYSAVYNNAIFQVTENFYKEIQNNSPCSSSFYTGKTFQVSNAHNNYIASINNIIDKLDNGTEVSFEDISEIIILDSLYTQSVEEAFLPITIQKNIGLSNIENFDSILIENIAYNIEADFNNRAALNIKLVSKLLIPQDINSLTIDSLDNDINYLNTQCEILTEGIETVYNYLDGLPCTSYIELNILEQPDGVAPNEIYEISYEIRNNSQIDAENVYAVYEIYENHQILEDTVNIGTISVGETVTESFTLLTSYLSIPSYYDIRLFSSNAVCDGYSGLLLSEKEYLDCDLVSYEIVDFYLSSQFASISDTVTISVQEIQDVNYTWEVNGEEISSDVLIKLNNLSVGTYEIKLKATINECSKEITKKLYVIENSNICLNEIIDSDNDGLTDCIENNVIGSNSNNSDTDGDGINDLDEIEAGTSPSTPDTDNDGISDAEEIENNTNPNCDNNNAPIWYLDADNDGFGDVNTFIQSCEQPNGYVANNTDSNDSVFDCYQEIELKAGWNLISLFVQPESRTITDVFGGLKVGNLKYVTGFNNGASIYDPDLPPFLNTLIEVEDRYAYWVKVEENDQLAIQGRCTNEAFPFEFNNGWNLMGYITEEAFAPEVYLSGLIDLGVLKYISGFKEGTLTFDPELPPFLNTLKLLERNYGYWVKLDSGSGKALQNPSNIFNFINGTSNLPAGERINVISESGETIAVLEVIQEGYLMTSPIYGDDPITEDMREGVLIGEKLLFSWNDQILDVEVNFTGDLSVEQINLVFEDIANLNNNLSLKVYPVPAKDIVNFEFETELEGEFLLQIFDTKGRLVESIKKATLSIGKQIIDCNVQSLSNGIYTYKLISGEQKQAGKFTK